MRWGLAAMVVGLIPLQAGAQQQASVAERARAALEMPRIMDSLRAHGGIPEGEIAGIVRDVMRRAIPANEARTVLIAADSAIKQHGPVDNFGAFVQARLEAGLRGRDLARAIREEHARRGIGKGRMRGEQGGGPPGDAGRGAKGRGQDSAAKTKGKGRP